MGEKIILQVNGKVAWITLNNPRKFNCIGVKMLEALQHTLDEVARNEEVRVLVFRGAGDKAFSSGADLNEYTILSAEQAEEWNALGNRVFDKIASFPKPTVAFINGYAIGGGLEMALACDFRIGTEKAILSSPEVEHGWLPGWGGMTRLRNLIGEARAREVVMLNEKISANEALRMGLLTRVLKDDSGAEVRAEPEAEAEPEPDELGVILDHLASLNPAVVRKAKSALSWH